MQILSFLLIVNNESLDVCELTIWTTAALLKWKRKHNSVRQSPIIQAPKSLGKCCSLSFLIAQLSLASRFCSNIVFNRSMVLIDCLDFCCTTDISVNPAPKFKSVAIVFCTRNQNVGKQPNKGDELVLHYPQYRGRDGGWPSPSLETYALSDTYRSINVNTF